MSSDVDTLEKKLNIKLSADIAQRCPQFLQILEKLSEKIDSRGLTQGSKDKLEAAKEKAENSRRKYLEVAVRLEILKEVIMTNELKSLSNPGLKHEIGIVNKLKENITLAEVTNMINLGDIKGTPVNVLGLDPVEVKERSSKSGVSDMGRYLVPMVEDILFIKCLSLLKFLDPELDPSQSRSILHPRIMRLSDKVADLMISNQMNKQELNETNDEWSNSFEQQCSVLNKIIENLEKLIQDFYSGSFSNFNSEVVKNLSVEIDSLLVKLKNMILDVDNNLYTGDSVQALKKIRNRLSSKIRDLESETVNTKTRLEQYQQCGPELSQIVSSYARIQKDIEMKKWALSELHQNK